jgi:hypothetical protein
MPQFAVISIPQVVNACDVVLVLHADAYPNVGRPFQPGTKFKPPLRSLRQDLILMPMPMRLSHPCEDLLDIRNGTST